MARKSRVAAVYMQVIPSMDGFFDAITRETDSQMPEVGKKSGNMFGNAFGKAWKALKIGSMVAGGIGAALTGVLTGKILKGGISRALNIEDAQATLKGLGYQAEQIAGVTDNVLASVRGTAFALDDAMGIAASALAAGVPEGEELTDYLKLIADTATITKSDLGEIGGVFNRIEASGRAYTQELNMLADRGLPVFSWLQDAFGVTAEELRKMVSDGEVDSATFAKVLEENIGGAALTSADTTRGALANLNAAFGRLGAVATGGSLPYLKDFFVTLIPFVDKLSEVLAPLAEQFWATFGPKATAFVGDFLNYVIGLIEGTQKLPQPLLDVFDIVKNVAAIFQAWYTILTPLLPSLITIALAITNALLPIVERLSEVLKDNRWILEGVILAFVGWKVALGGFTIITTIIGSVKAFTAGVSAARTALYLITAATYGSNTALNMSVVALTKAATAWVANKVAAAGTWIAKQAADILGVVKALTIQAAAWVRNTAAMVAARVAGLASAAWMGIVTAAQWAWNAAMSANPIGLLIAAIGALVAGLIWFFTQTKIGQEIWANLTKFIGDSINNIGKWLAQVGQGVGNFFSGIANGFANFFSGIANFFIGIINLIIRSINNVISLINSISIPVPDWAQGVLGGSKTIGFNISAIKNIPQLATGANVMGPTVALVGEKRPETVTDLGLTNRQMEATRRLAEQAMRQSSDISERLAGNSNAGTTINVYQQPGESIEELATRLYEFYEFNKTEGSVGYIYG